MNYQTTGNFIYEQRKKKGLTQLKLAEKLNVSEKTISKWECGKGFPDTSIIMPLCKELDITANELFNGEKLTNENSLNKAEEQLMEMQQLKENAEKRLLSMEIVIGILSIAILLSLTFIASYINMVTWQRILLISFGFIMAVFGIIFGIKIEQVAGFYVCKHCNHKYIPLYKSVLLAPHINRTRYMKCPHCNKKSWHKKVIK